MSVHSKRWFRLSFGLALSSCASVPLVVADSGEVFDAGASPVDCNAGAEKAPDVAFTERGPVRGEVSAVGRAFRGVPFAKAPVGNLRWRPPQRDSTCWSGVRDAKAWGAVCPHIPQAQGVPFDAGAPIEGNEDCLTLNVFSPSTASPDAGLPVMVFIHGGGNTSGSTSEFAGQGVRVYDGTRLAKAGNVVVVTMEYRLGALGFLSLEPLDAQRDAGAAGNYGLLDQQAALEWVKRNIASFGGDASRVLLFGESAGAVDTCMQLAMPGSSGLFHRALIQSGSCHAPSLAARRMEGAKWLSGTGCSSASDVPACLRALSTEQVIRAFPVPIVVGARKGEVSWGPTVDGVVLPKSPLEAMEAGTHSKVPLVVGANTEETNLTMPLITTDAEYRANVTALVGLALADSVVSLYPVATYGTPRKALVQVTTDAFFGCQARLAARAAARGQAGIGVYRYLFARAPVALRGAFHGVELAYVFQKVSEYSATPSPVDLSVESQVLSLWTKFAATGNPGMAGSTTWPAYATQETLLRIGDTASTVSGWRTTECDFFDTFTGMSVPAP